MNLYLDDDSADTLLIRLLETDAHDVQFPAQVGLSGEFDVTHFMHAIRTGRVLLTHNHDDFKRLHELVLLVTGHHPGILVVRRDNDPTRDLRPRGHRASATQPVSQRGVDSGSAAHRQPLAMK